MPVMNFDLEDGLPPVSFTLKPQDCERFMQFMAECQAMKESASVPVQAVTLPYQSPFACMNNCAQGTCRNRTTGCQFECAVRKEQAVTLTDEPTIVEIDREGARFWHRNCTNHLGGVMQEVKREPVRSLIQCRHCGKCGYYPVGGAGLVRADEEYIWNRVTDCLPEHGQMIRGRSDNGEWDERFDSNKPIGAMTEWRLLAGSAKGEAE